jgi:hypothetical protein
MCLPSGLSAHNEVKAEASANEGDLPTGTFLTTVVLTKAVVKVRPAARGAAAPRYPFQVRPTRKISRFGLSTSIAGRCQHIVHILIQKTCK